MEQKIEDMVKAQISKSEEKLRAARLLLKDEFFDDAISRAYYAVFHAANAVLLTEGMNAESHSGLKTLFGLRFIKTGKIDRKYGRILNKLKDERENGDYDIFTDFDLQDTEEMIEEAEEFVAEMKRFLGQEQ
jgi:hypothetical protein